MHCFDSLYSMSEPSDILAASVDPMLDDLPIDVADAQLEESAVANALASLPQRVTLPLVGLGQPNTSTQWGLIELISPAGNC